MVVHGATGAISGSKAQTALGIMGLMGLIGAFWPAALLLGGRLLRSLPPWQSHEDALQRGTHGQLRIDDDAVTLRSLHVPRSAIECGWREASSRVVLRLRNERTMLLELPDPRTADAVLSHLGLAATQRVARMPLASSVVSQGRGVWFHVLSLYLGGSLCLGLLVGAGVALSQGTWASGIGAAVAATLAALLVRLYVSVSRQGEVSIGSDGLRVRTRRGERFVPYADIVAVRRVIVPAHVGGSRSSIRIALREGEPITLQVGNMMDGTPMLLDAMQQRLTAAWEAWQHRQRADAPQLDIRTHKVGELKEKLRIAIREGDYRHARLQPEQLSAVLEDDGARPKLRFAAAVALLDETEGKKRIEQVRARIADDTLGSALDAALSDRLRDDDLKRLERQR